MRKDGREKVKLDFDRGRGRSDHHDRTVRGGDRTKTGYLTERGDTM